MKTRAVCRALSRPTSQSLTPRNPPAGSRVCRKHLFDLLGGKPAVNAPATQNNPHERVHETHTGCVDVAVLIPSCPLGTDV